MSRLFALALAAVPAALADLGAHAGFPVERALPGAPTYTYLSVNSPDALNLDGSRYGIAVCLSTVSNSSWQFSTDGGGWCYDELFFLSVRLRRSGAIKRGPPRRLQWAATREGP